MIKSHRCRAVLGAAAWLKNNGFIRFSLAVCLKETTNVFVRSANWGGPSAGDRLVDCVRTGPSASFTGSGENRKFNRRGPSKIARGGRTRPTNLSQ
jgi:hypothetical protein